MENLLHVPRETVQEVKRMDLLTYLERYEPHELVRLSNGVHSTRSPDCPGAWSSESQSERGNGAITITEKPVGWAGQKMRVFRSPAF